MKFSDKLFFATTAVMTLIFTVFGIWVLSSFFQKILNRELEQGNTESQMFQYVFEMAYKSVPKEYGEEYSLKRATESVMGNLAKDGSNYYIFDQDNQLVYGAVSGLQQPILDSLIEIQTQLDGQNTYGYRILSREGARYLLTSCRSENEGVVLYLAVQKDISAIYEDREVLLNQYRFVLILLLFIGTVVIFLLSRYMTQPIRTLTDTARKISSGNLEARSRNTSMDEIGELSRSFNQMADRLVDRMQEKELEARQQEDFTSAFAHELKTPLTSIIGYADMLSTMQMSEAERSEAAYYIFTQGKRLEKLSHKLLELVSVEKQELQKKVISTKELEENIRQTIRPILAKKGIHGKIVMEKGRIYGDKDLLFSLLYNLLDNGMKAVDEGGFILLKGSWQQDEYEFKVVDNGRGIPAEEISRITEAFYMVDKSRSRKEGGAGIGMALCQKIVKLHGGRLLIDSRQGEGTVIQILLPGKGGMNEKKV